MTGDPLKPAPSREPDPTDRLGDGELIADVAVITDVEVVDGPLVLARARVPMVRVAPQGAALVQAAAVAATGFVAGAATAAVLGRRRQRRLAAGHRDGPVGPLRAVSHRTYLVDVHLLERR